ncbi:diguanylate cyclase (GGDEF) domain-containing protein [Pseudomonas sp. GM49]|uniref:GGDEF domain-containing protein n=1 Tax=Pseudomonas sp. GM49 TaxID=1144331 RepID=UPI00026FE502|nr:GGDEF domain-containing protein [Pseudomonas sp. GM49]EJM62183.1 diguanylate cyclase (GGDEF) domain-containing protein [Pseudomonas sp. GM49]
MLISGKTDKSGRSANPLLTPQQERERLRDLARRAEQELAGVQMASMDELTLLSNRHGFTALARLGLNACREVGMPATLLYFTLDEFKRMNYLYGRAKGDDALKTFADVLRIGFRENDVVGRLEGDRFVALLTGSSVVEIAAIKARLDEILDERNATAHRSYDIRFSVVQIEYDPVVHGSIEELLGEAESVMSR